MAVMMREEIVITTAAVVVILASASLLVLGIHCPAIFVFDFGSGTVDGFRLPRRGPSHASVLR
jgi:hypothetical protein